MESRFYTNYSDVKFIDKIKENIDLCQAFYFSVSFIKKPGLKLLAELSSVFAKAEIGIFAISTYNTDYVLVKDKDYRKAIKALDRAGYRVLDG